jgi:hypothetical protein
VSFEKRKAVPLAAAFLVAVGIGSTATADTGVEIYSTNVTLNGGDIGLGGGDIRDSGVVVWNSSQGFVPAASVEVNPIQSGTTSSDVGLGQVENEAQVAESGDNLTGDLNLTGNTITNVGSPVDGNDVATRQFVNNNDDVEPDTNAGTICTQSNQFLNGNGNCEFDDEGPYLPTDEPSQSVDFSDENLIGVNKIEGGNFADTTIDMDASDNNDLELSSDGDSIADIRLDANGNVELFADAEDDNIECQLDASLKEFRCDVAKNWVHDLNTTHKAVYSAQESPEVRAVYEGQAATSNGRVNVSLPSHFSKTVSDTRPSLRVQATPHQLATVAVTERTDDYLVVESSKDVTVDYRVTGIREGYEDKQVVRKK